MARVPVDNGGPPVRGLPRIWPGWKLGWQFGWHFGWIEGAFLCLIVLALVMRLWELGGRAMHYDEAIHVHYAWRLVNSSGAAGGWPWIFGTDFIHSPWMHGPFQIEFTALIFRIFGDSDFTSRLGYVLFGAALVGLPYFLRDYLGRAGALFAAVMLALSPTMLYFSRFGRNDILMAFWATALLVLMWRYLHEGKHRYLYLASVTLAFMFGTKETAYIVALIFGATMFILAVPDLINWALRRKNLSQLAGPAGFLLLLVTLTLPQWVPIMSLAQDALGITLANADGVAGGLVGAPHWAGRFVELPVYGAAWWLHALAAIVLVAGLAWLAKRWGLNVQSLILALAVPTVAIAASLIALFRPIDGVWSFGGAPFLDFVIAGIAVGSGVAILIVARHPWRSGTLLLIIPAQLAAIYAFFLTGIVNVDSMVNGVLPIGISVDASSNAIPVNYLVAAGLLVGALNLSIYLGVRWLGGRWLLMAGIFYLTWITIYSTVFTNMAGVFSGVWQGMGYWIAQQDVARGNQPWYYYFVGLSIYEILPLVFGIAGAVYFIRKRDMLGLALAMWSAGTLIIYTIASEKMPWLIVNVSLPFILLAGKYLGELFERVRWREVVRKGQVALVVLPPMTVASIIYLLYSYAKPEVSFSGAHWALMFSTALLAAAGAYIIRLAQPANGTALVALGLAGLLLGFGTWGALRAAYTFDDSNKELLVYAQGSSDLRDSYRKIDSQVLQQQPASRSVTVDYDIWYPFNWYVRDAQKDGILSFSCFKAEEEDGWNSGCNPIEAEHESKALLISEAHAGDTAALPDYKRDGPMFNLLWFYEDAYRRPGENRQAEGHPGGIKGLPNKNQITKDFGYFNTVASSRLSWFHALDYVLFRNLEGEWYNSKYYSYFPP